jgi:hypothetical protein
VPFIRVSRDKRGYDNLIVKHDYRPFGPGPQRTRVLYLFRSPTHLKVGRTMLDSEVREALEHTHPDLTFDWDAFQRDQAAAARLERGDRGPAERGHRQWTGARPARQAPDRPSRPAPDRSAPLPAPPAPLPPDDSVLGRTLGAGQAAVLRQRYQEVLVRVSRRAPTPEERDRLTSELVRLNPDDWSDEAAIRAGVSTAPSEWARIASALPSRRRGRRGGRDRERFGGGGHAAPEASGIMAEGEAPDEEGDTGGAGESNDTHDSRGGGDASGSADGAPAGAPDPGADPGVSGGD